MAIFEEIRLKPGNTFIVIGCGHGFFLLPAARIAGDRGTIYGIDINATVIASLRDRFKTEDLEIVVLKTGKAEESIVCKECADIVFFGIVLHDFKDPGMVLDNARLILKPGGLLVDLDWKKEPTPVGPPLDIRFTESRAVRLIEAAKFKVERVKDSGSYHYMVLATKRQ